MSKLHVDSLIKTFGTKQVLTDIYLTCSKGEIIGLLGRNGSGKSTLLKIIFGSLRADRKFIKIGDKLAHKRFNNREQIKYLPQDSFLPSHLKVHKIIELFSSSKHALTIKNNALIAPFIHKKSKQLSGGERRLLELFLIIHSNAKHVLIDEPFNGVAPIYKEEIKQLIKKQSEHKGFIITDHDYRSILDVSTRILLMHDGGIKNMKNNNELIQYGYLPHSS